MPLLLNSLPNSIDSLIQFSFKSFSSFHPFIIQFLLLGVCPWRTKYIFQLAQKPTTDTKNASADSEMLSCNPKFITYLKTNNTSGVSNLRQSRQTCESTSTVSSGAAYNVGGTGLASTGSGNTSGTSGTGGTEEPKSFKYMNKGKYIEEEKSNLPVIIGIVVVILIILGGLYYYFTQVAPGNTVTLESLKNPTSKFLKKKGGYFFFI